ncbi:TPA: hypothetical protein ACVO1C_003139 [Vibrio diabolicus]
MSSLNRYINNQINYIKALQQLPLVGLTNQLGETASWQDAAWRFNTPQGKIHYYFINSSVKSPSFSKRYSSSQLLESHLRHLVMAYTITINAYNASNTHKIALQLAARQFLGLLDDNPANLNTNSLAIIVNKLGSPEKFTQFGKWLKDNAFIPSTIKLPSFKTKKLAGSEIIDHRKRLLPDSKVLMALGAITYDTISPEPKSWDTHPLKSQRDAFVCAMSALAMGSPNRVDAEQTVLAKQTLKKVSHKTLKGSDRNVHYLNWQGSKGYEDYNNHILNSMAEPINRCLNYFNKVCEPGRVLARFYENPTQALSKLLGDFTPSKELLLKAKVELDKPIHLIKLGFILGFYDHIDGKVAVSQSTNGAKRSKHATYYHKDISQLQIEDELIISEKLSIHILGITLQKKHISQIFGRKVVSVQDFQNKWIEHIYKNIPSFPTGHNNSKRGKIKYKHALFCFTGKQIYTSKPTYSAAGSFYGLAPLTALGEIFSTELQNNQKGKLKSTIFTRHRFSDDFYITPNQFRHWMDDTAERHGVPHAIINLWSGRKSPEQLLHYTHRTHAERSSEISDILFNDSDEDISIKVVSQQKYDELTKTAAAATATGFCTQDLVYSPCEFLNDFVTQCPLCPDSCHVNRDEKAIKLLEKDLTVQNFRLNEIKSRQNFRTSKAMQKWFVTHQRNTSILKELIELMKSTNIKAGSLIRLLVHNQEIRITDLEHRIVEKRILTLPDPNEALSKALEEKQPVQPDNPLNDAIEALGWK